MRSEVGRNMQIVLTRNSDANLDLREELPLFAGGMNDIFCTEIYGSPHNIHAAQYTGCFHSGCSA